VKRGGRNEAAQAYLYHRDSKHPKSPKCIAERGFIKRIIIFFLIKGLVYPKIKMLSSFVKLCDFISSMDTKDDI